MAPISLKTRQPLSYPHILQIYCLWLHSRFVQEHRRGSGNTECCKRSVFALTKHNSSRDLVLRGGQSIRVLSQKTACCSTPRRCKPPPLRRSRPSEGKKSERNVNWDVNWAQIETSVLANRWNLSYYFKLQQQKLNVHDLTAQTYHACLGMILMMKRFWYVDSKTETERNTSMSRIFLLVALNKTCKDSYSSNIVGLTKRYIWCSYLPTQQLVNEFALSVLRIVQNPRVREIPRSIVALQQLRDGQHRGCWSGNMRWISPTYSRQVLRVNPLTLMGRLGEEQSPKEEHEHRWNKQREDARPTRHSAWNTQHGHFDPFVEICWLKWKRCANKSSR
jgi:hypothetical protein